MKSVLTALVALVFCTLAAADTTSDLFAVQKSPLKNPNSALGVWEMGPLQNNGITFTVRMRIEQNQVTAGLKCEHAGQVAMVSVTVPATLTDNTMTPNADAAKDINQNGTDCNVSVKAGATTHYTINNGVLTADNAPMPAYKISD